MFYVRLSNGNLLLILIKIKKYFSQAGKGGASFGKLNMP